MTTGPEHFRRAEELADLSLDTTDQRLAGLLLTRAQVHASLAHAAATALVAFGPYAAETKVALAWRELLAVKSR